MPDADVLDYAVKLVQVIGIPVGIILYFLNKRKERLEREYGTYNALDEKYIDYLKLCLDNPDLDGADIPKTETVPLTEAQRYRELVMFSILLSIMERAFLMYKDKSENVRQAQWRGWESYIRTWCTRPNFANALPKIEAQFDEDFIAYLNTGKSNTTL